MKGLPEGLLTTSFESLEPDALLLHPRVVTQIEDAAASHFAQLENMLSVHSLQVLRMCPHSHDLEVTGDPAG